MKASTALHGYNRSDKEVFATLSPPLLLGIQLPIKQTQWMYTVWARTLRSHLPSLHQLISSKTTMVTTRRAFRALFEPTSQDLPVNPAPTQIRFGRARAHSTTIKEEVPSDDLDTDAKSPVKRKRRSSPAAAQAQETKPQVDGKKARTTPSLSKPKVKSERAPPAPPTWPTPAEWRTTYALLSAQRDWLAAPVDTVGCEATGSNSAEEFAARQSTQLDPVAAAVQSATVEATVDSKPAAREDLTVRKEFATLVALLLSSQTKDPVTAAAVKSLQDALPGGLTAESVAAASEETIQKCIAQVGFWRRKTGYLQGVAHRLLERPGDLRGRPPHTLEELVAFNGIGPKMAYLFLQSVGLGQGIGVDTHVHRISSRLGWTQPLNKPKTSPETTRTQLEAFLPRELWGHINFLLVGFGQTVCTPVSPRCDMCAVAQRQRAMGRKSGGPLCPSMLSVNQARSQHRVPISWRTYPDMLLRRAQQEGEWKNGIGVPTVPIELEVDQFVQHGLPEPPVKKDGPVDDSAEHTSVQATMESAPMKQPKEESLDW